MPAPSPEPRATILAALQSDANMHAENTCSEKTGLYTRSRPIIHRGVSGALRLGPLTFTRASRLPLAPSYTWWTTSGSNILSSGSM